MNADRNWHRLALTTYLTSPEPLPSTDNLSLSTDDSSSYWFSLRNCHTMSYLQYLSRQKVSLWLRALLLGLYHIQSERYGTCLFLTRRHTITMRTCEMRTTPCQTVLPPHHINHPRAAACQSVFLTHFYQISTGILTNHYEAGSVGCINCLSLFAKSTIPCFQILHSGQLPRPHLWASWQSLCNGIPNRWYILGLGASVEYYLAYDDGGHRYK